MAVRGWSRRHELRPFGAWLMIASLAVAWGAALAPWFRWTGTAPAGAYVGVAAGGRIDVVTRLGQVVPVYPTGGNSLHAWVTPADDARAWSWALPARWVLALLVVGALLALRPALPAGGIPWARPGHRWARVVLLGPLFALLPLDAALLWGVVSGRAGALGAVGVATALGWAVVTAVCVHKTWPVEGWTEPYRAGLTWAVLLWSALWVAFLLWVGWVYSSHDVDVVQIAGDAPARLVGPVAAGPTLLAVAVVLQVAGWATGRRRTGPRPEPAVVG